MKKIIAIGIAATLIILFSVVCVSATWYDTDFSYRKQIIVSHANASGDTLTNYPAFINVSKEPEMQSDFDDIRFVDNSGNLMAFELENYTTSYALYWVNITSLPNSGQTFWMYYGNDAATSQENPEGVWNSSVKMVHHFQDFEDSTSNNNDGTNHGSTYNESGQIDGARDFDGTDDYVDCGNDESLDITDAITIEAWVNPKSYPGNMNFIIGKGAQWGYTSKTIMDICRYYGQGIRFQLGNGTDTNCIYVNQFPLSEWTHFAATSDGSTMRFYVNGIEKSSDSFDGVDITGGRIILGEYPQEVGYSNNNFNGTIDEVRIYNRALSADWTKQNYEMVVNQSTWVSWGSAEESWVNTPMNLDNTHGNFWVNWIWEANNTGDALHTDSFNISYWVNENHYWDNSTNTSRNETVGAHGWLNISVYAYNTSTGKLSDAVSDSYHFSNNVPVITNTSDWQGDEGELVYLDFNYTDADGDTCTFSTNATKGSFNTATGVFEWYTGMGDEGTYYWNFTVNDSWGGSDSYIATITVGNLGCPNITAWYNNYTCDNSTNFTIAYTDNRSVFFNVTANQTIDYWVWYVDGTLYQNSSSNNITKTWDEGGNKTVSVYGVNANGQTNTLIWNIEIEYTVHEYAKLIYHQNLLLIEAEKMLAQMWMFLVLLLIDFGMILFFFANTRNRIYGNVAVGLLSVFLTFILAHRALLYPVEMPDLSLFLNGIALMMMVFTILVIIEIVIEKMGKAVS